LVNKKPILKIVDNIGYDNWGVENSKIISDAIIKIESINYNYNVLKKYII
jgi:hypothetical protein